MSKTRHINRPNAKGSCFQMPECYGGNLYSGSQYTSLRIKECIFAENMWVTLVNPDNTTVTTTTNANGAYSFANLLPGTYSVAFTAPGRYNFIHRLITAQTPLLTPGQN